MKIEKLVCDANPKNTFFFSVNHDNNVDVSRFLWVTRGKVKSPVAGGFASKHLSSKHNWCGNQGTSIVLVSLKWVQEYYTA